MERCRKVQQARQAKKHRRKIQQVRCCQKVQQTAKVASEPWHQTPKALAEQSPPLSPTKPAEEALQTQPSPGAHPRKVQQVLVLLFLTQESADNPTTRQR